METMQPTLRNGRNTWDRINMPESEFKKRLSRVRKEMKKEGINVLLLYGNAFNEYGNYCYLSNYIIRLPRGALVVVPRKGELTLLFEGAVRGLPSVKKTTWIEDIKACGDISKETVKCLREKKLIPSSVGFIGLRQLMPNVQLKFLYDSLTGCKMIHADDLLRNMRMVKSQKEADQVRRSSRILKHAFNFISMIPFQNMNERVLEAMVRREARLEGAEDFRMMIARPKEERWAFRPAEETNINPGETLIICLVVEFERYWAEAIRTFLSKETCLAESSSGRIQPLYEKLVSGMRPKKRVSEFYEETMTEIQKAGFEFIPTYGLGQGIGLSPKEFPAIIGDDDALMEQGMFFTFRLLIKDKDLGAVMLGNTLCLTKHGEELLT